jgi:hypothetical protein
MKTRDLGKEIENLIKAVLSVGLVIGAMAYGLDLFHKSTKKTEIVRVISVGTVVETTETRRSIGGFKKTHRTSAGSFKKTYTTRDSVDVQLNSTNETLMLSYSDTEGKNKMLGQLRNMAINKQCAKVEIYGTGMRSIHTVEEAKCN